MHLTVTLDALIASHEAVVKEELGSQEPGLGPPPLGFNLPPSKFSTTEAPNRERAVFRAKKALEGLVYDAVRLEGNPFTFPEVKTLLEGTTVGGHRVADAEQVLNTAESWRELFALVEDGSFALTTDVACSLHGIAARDEALEWGALRTGRIGVAGTNMVIPPASALKARCEDGLDALEGIRDPHRRAIAAFLFFARNQFFWDVNKRVGRLMMNGVLLSNGFDAINVPEARRLEFNEAMVGFYDTLDAGRAMAFMASCSLDPALRAECDDSPPGANRH